MSTLNQLARRQQFKKKPRKRTPRLTQCPQRKALVVRFTFATPRKPNSARRSVVKVILSNRKRLTAYLPGLRYSLKKFNKIFVRGGGARDLPGVRYSCVRGVKDCYSVKHKTKRRSIYGVRMPDEKRRVRRKDKMKKILKLYAD